MRRPIFLTLLAAGALHIDSFAQQLTPAVKQLYVHAQAGVQELECEKKSPQLRPAAAPNPDPLEVPTDEMIETMTPPEPAPSNAPPNDSVPHSPAVRPLPSKDGFRLAIWGDSHLAAGFFTEELVKLLKFPADSVANALIPANMGKPGVRLPIRRSCVSPQWKYELGYLGGEAAAAPGPGLVNMFSDQAGSTLAWDVRKDAQSPGYERVRILYQQTEAPMVVAISADGDAETEVTLDGKAGPAVLELVADQPVSQVRLRLIDARFRFHGLELLSKHSSGFELAVFGYPGATVAGWKTAHPDYLSAWFAGRNYQLVVLEFGTNEGNVKPFDASTYQRTLSESVRNMRAVFPAAACILIAPGDRGILVPRSVNIRNIRNIRKNPGAVRRELQKMTSKMRLVLASLGKRNRKIQPVPPIDLLQYSKIHAQIGRIQAQVAADAGCSAWSMQDAMGGPGHSYEWAHRSPALMSGDLIHFTVAGYQRLAQGFAKEMGWISPSRERVE